MRKSDKKIENQLRIALTEVCETALNNFTGFEWLTHLVNHSNFPKSLKVICVFDTNDNLSNFINSKSSHELDSLIQKNLFEKGINLKNITNHISYDTEENCQTNNNGKWADRLE
ncbi:Fis family transcriptional regulator [Candidatus Colwellia aromaticivorans]|uniref:Fis family transcriptional regulator n=1 Tax=Candidatus Colwellia aromaticivorans TaxID=2267621 RepID=UPI000DF237EB|nr:Fis family transcriptional regulator [Candidatus Colwellia aromaticivorans]